MADISIVKSLWGRIIGLDQNNDLVVNGRRVTTSAAGGLGTANGTGVVATEEGTGVINRTILTCTATPITVTDEAGISQWGGAGKIYDFPEGMIWLAGAIVSGSITLGATGTFITTWAGIGSLGTVAASATGAATLVTTAATWLQQFAISAATARVATIDGVSVATQLTEAGSRWVDGTATAADLYFNIKVTDDATHTSGTGTFTGTVKFIWANLGDN